MRSNTLLTVEEVEAAMHRHLRDEAYTWSQKRLGVDVARFGDDRSVIFPRWGLAAFRPQVMRGVRTTEIAATLACIAVLIARRTLDPTWWHVSGVVVGAIAVWFLIFGITGAFVRYLSLPRPLVRYFSEASYWMYLLHVVPITCRRRADPRPACHCPDCKAVFR